MLQFGSTTSQRACPTLVKALSHASGPAVMAKRLAIVFVVLLVLGAIASTQITIFVVQPIGAVPEGRTLVLKRRSNLDFIDSPDAMCERRMGGVSLFCRASALSAAISGVDDILMRLKYSETLYGVSTGGKSYDR